MRRLTLLLLVFSAGLFVASSAVFMFTAQGSGVSTAIIDSLTTSTVGERVPQRFALRLLQIVVWFAVLSYSLRAILRYQAQWGLLAHRHDHSLMEHGPLILSLLAAAAWPWVSQIGPLGGVLTAATMAGGALATVLTGERDGRQRRQRSSLGFYAGWAVAAAMGTFGGFLTLVLGWAPGLSAFVGISLLTLATVLVQLRLGPAIAFTVAVLWALIGTTAAAMAENMMIAASAVMAIAALAALLVRVTT